MKFLAILIIVSLGVSAHAGHFGFTGETACTGDVVGAPISLNIKWGKVIESTGNLPPYWIHQVQKAVVKVAFNGKTTTEEATFQESGGTTRCEWWNKAGAQLFLNQAEPIIELEIDNSWNHSGCGHLPSGTFVKKSKIPSQTDMLNCQYFTTEEQK